MATKQSGQSASQVPISKHPAFPAIVALWFAALLGIGSLVLPASLFEGAIDTGGLAGVLPAAAPPLGVSARILIALVAAAVGVMAGLFVARKVAAAQGRTARTLRRAPGPAEDGLSVKRPISAHEELWSEGFDGPVEDARAAPFGGRRRALPVTNENGPSDLLDSAPLPSGETEIVLETSSAPEPVEAPAEEDALELAVFAASAEIGHDSEPVEPPASGFAETRDEDGETALENAALAAEPSQSIDRRRPFDAPASTPAPFAEAENDVPESVDIAEQADDPQEYEPISAARSEAQKPALGELSIAELVERFALSLQRAAERAAAEAEVEASSAADGVEPPPRYVPDLGVEAIEAPRFAPAGEPAAVRQSDEEPAGDPATAIPAALRPVAFGEDEADEGEGEEVSLSLSLTREARPFDLAAGSCAPAAHDEPEDGDDASDRGYSSLLDMRKQAAGREFVRIEDEAPAAGAVEDEAIGPVVVLPGQDQRRAAPPAERSADPAGPQTASVERPFAAPSPANGGASDSMQTERALREALYKLQRLSGAA